MARRDLNRQLDPDSPVNQVWEDMKFEKRLKRLIAKKKKENLDKHG